MKVPIRIRKVPTTSRNSHLFFPIGPMNSMVASGRLYRASTWPNAVVGVIRTSSPAISAVKRNASTMVSVLSSL